MGRLVPNSAMDLSLALPPAPEDEAAAEGGTPEKDATARCLAEAGEDPQTIFHGRGEGSA